MTLRIRPQEPSDDEAVLSIFRESFPDLPHGTTDEYRRGVDGWRQRGLEFRQYVSEESGRVVGCGCVITIESEEPGLFDITVTVRPSDRRRGVGTALLDQCMTHADELGYRRTLSWVIEVDPGTDAFVAKHGYRRNGASEQQSRLHVPSVKLTGFQDLEDGLMAGGVSIDLLGDRVDDGDFMEKLYRVDMTSHRDVPSSVAWKDIPYEHWLDFGVLGPGRRSGRGWRWQMGNRLGWRG